MPFVPLALVTSTLSAIIFAVIVPLLHLLFRGCFGLPAHQSQNNLLNSKCNKGTITAKMIADNVDVTRARGTKDITT